MRRFAEVIIVVLALAGFLAGGTASAAMQPGSAMTAAMPEDCPHAGADAGAGHAQHLPAAKALALMACCFGTGPGLSLISAEPAPRFALGLRFHPASDAVPAASAPGPETPPPRA